MNTQNKNKKMKMYLYGTVIGFINALFGAGGGMIAVPLLKKLGANQKSAQATAICIILPLSLITSAIYLFKGYVTFGDASPYIIPGFFGAMLGTTLLSRISNNILKKIFAVFMLWAGIRMITG